MQPNEPLSAAPRTLCSSNYLLLGRAARRPARSVEEGYREWRAEFERGKAGAFGISVADAIGYVESTLQIP